MSYAFKCDHCHQYVDGEPNSQFIRTQVKVKDIAYNVKARIFSYMNSERELHLCEDCKVSIIDTSLTHLL